MLVDSNPYREQLDRVYAVLSAKYFIAINRSQAILQYPSGQECPAHRSRFNQGKISELQGVNVWP